MIKTFCLSLIRAYQIIVRFVSPLPRCRFYPTCSEYTYQSIENSGITKGIFLGTKRIFKCHPLHPGGYDPVWKKE
ncbi:MAG: membrane protein insertion efficiency factor YidD [Elusimicrobia bacterium]|nr:membrane protein insertion efficiency factor YidD [Elusimicrobiota bacterium]MBU2614906.1 membrane protein insertion efficiency factor YidD [Elusimicrobiota bacterium]